MNLPFECLEIVYLQVSYGVDVIVALLGQGLVSNWNRGQLLSLTPFIIILFYSYQGIVTRDMLRPMEETQLETILDVKDAGYSFAVENEFQMRYFAGLFAHQARKHGLDPSPYSSKTQRPPFKIIPGLHQNKSQFFRLLAEHRAYAMFGHGFSLPYPTQDYYQDK